MKKNIVMIQTIENVGTGILYPCHYDKAKENCNSFIVFTNRHVLGDLGSDELRQKELLKDMKDSVILQIYDDNGNLVEAGQIKQVLVHNPLYDNVKQNDIAALLVDIDECVPITLQTRIYHGELQDRAILYMEGYPGIMLDDEISQKVQLEGMAKTIFPDNPHIGVYQIRDDYHWYNNYMDLKLMEGFSGSPVYIKNDNTTFLVGMNQSVADIDNGENPFKLVYYLKMRHLLECLRRTGCILFRRLKDDQYQIEWIYGLDGEINKYKRCPTFLLIGGSGAGKSSFAKDFALNGDMLYSTNDGQTTRTNVIYEYYLLCEHSEVEVQIMTQKEFANQMEKLYGIIPMLNYYHQVFGLSTPPSKRDSMKYLRDMFYLIENLSDEKEKWFVDLKKAFFLNESMPLEALWEVYESVEDILLKWVPVDQIKYICDREIISEIYKRYQEITAYERRTNGGHTESNEECLHEIIKRYWRDGVSQDIFRFLFHLCEDNDFNFEKYQIDCAAHLKHNRAISDINQEQIHMLWRDSEWKKELFECVLRLDGFFDISEFEFLGVNRRMLFESEAEEASNNSDKMNLRNFTRELCEKIHGVIRDKLSEYFESIKYNRFSITFCLDELSKKDKQLLALCLQKVDNKSLTGIIRLVKIRDRVSDEYALLLKELEIKELRLLDTYGLDHVEWGGDAKDVLHDIQYRYKEREGINIDDLGVLYLKKLDSGRPEELKNVLPCVYEVIPQAPIYCVFSGIDIFYQNNPIQIENIYWKKGNESSCPKAVQYILSDKGEKEIIEHIDCREERKKNYYLVMRNNLVPYCGKKELVRGEYAYYQNNLKYVQKVLASMLMNEYDSLEIVDVDMIKQRMDKMNDLKTLFFRLLDKIFERASVRSWNYYHHMTVKANFRRIADDQEDELGYWGVNRQRWDQLFHEAYKSVFSNESETFISQFPNGKDAVEAAIFKMEDQFLGSSRDLYQKKIDSHNEFRIILQDMYNNYENGRNPFKDKISLTEFSQAERKKYLEDVFDFAKRLRKDHNYYERYWKFFKDTLIKQLEKDNHSKAENLVELNLDFADSLHRLEKDFMMMYGEGVGSASKKLHQILNYYFSIIK